MANVYLALGSNIGDRQKHIDLAIKRLNENKVHVIKTASVIETDPVGGPPQAKYLNTVIGCQTNLTPQTLHATTLMIENLDGRTRTVPNGPRTIDIDILMYDQLTMTSEHLTIPHPRMLNRDFVMKPLKEIDPLLVAKLTHACH